MKDIADKLNNIIKVNIEDMNKDLKNINNNSKIVDDNAKEVLGISKNLSILVEDFKL